MRSRISFSSIRLMLTLFICAFAMLFMQSIFGEEKSDFITDLLSALFGLSIVLLCFVPSVIIKRKANLDFISFVKLTTPSAVIFTSSYYALYFAFLLTGFLIRYTDVFTKELNPEANVYFVAVLMLAVCIYAASKGINNLSRAVIFIFALSFVAFFIITLGNIANLNFEINKSNFSFNYNSVMQGVLFYSAIAFIAVIFGFTSLKAEKYKLKHTIITVITVFVAAAVLMFFIYFSLGKYAERQLYEVYLLSKASHIGVVSGMDSLYLAVLTSSVFVLITALLISMSNSVERKCRKKALLLFAVAVFILFICAQNFNNVKDILTDYYILNFLNFISAVIIPVIYIIVFRRRLNV